MNKRIISALVLTGMIATTSAFASNARLLVMGTGGADNFSNGGSFYYEDAYNFFYNASYVNDYKNFAIFEKGNGSDGSSFGFVSSMMNMNLGMFFNRNAALPTGSNATDIMIGGDMGVKWGLGLTYGVTKLANDGKNESLGVRLGAQFSGFDPWANFQVIGEDKAAGAAVTKYTRMGIGARYHYGEWTPYAAFSSGKDKTEATGSEDKTTTMAIGLGRESKLAEGARLVYALYWVSSKNEVSTVAGSEVKSSKTPIDMAIEADALSWLTLRGGVNHVLGGGDGTTTARVGGTFHIGKADVDYAFGNTSSTTGTTSVSPDSENVGFDSGTFHKVAMRYSW